MYIYHHLGLGDHLICHGIVRNVCEKFNSEEHTLCLKPQFLTSVSFMYKDLLNLKFKSFDNDHQIHLFLENIPTNERLYIGHHHLEKVMKQGYNFDEAFYKQVGLNFKKRWEDFKIERNYSKELELFDKMNFSSGYVFLHDGSERNLSIDRTKIKNQNLKVIVPSFDLTDNIFDYLTLIERAEEIHCMDSSFKLMIDSVIDDRSNLFYHVNLANGARRPHTTANKLSWIIV